MRKGQKEGNWNLHWTGWPVVVVAVVVTDIAELWLVVTVVELEVDPELWLVVMVVAGSELWLVVVEDCPALRLVVVATELWLVVVDDPTPELPALIARRAARIALIMPLTLCLVVDVTRLEWLVVVVVPRLVWLVVADVPRLEWLVAVDVPD
jgi:hypothetical protein